MKVESSGFDNLLVRIYFIILMIRWTDLAPRQFEFPLIGSLAEMLLMCQYNADVTHTCHENILCFVPGPFLFFSLVGRVGFKSRWNISWVGWGPRREGGSESLRKEIFESHPEEQF